MKEVTRESSSGLVHRPASIALFVNIAAINDAKTKYEMMSRERPRLVGLSGPHKG